jgi:prepilin-type N-terminal cleavage/methylation domain-containing protein
MTEVPPAKNAPGFTILEMLIAMSVFLIICAAMFGLLQMSQTRYASENQLSASFQEARLAMDQIVRDINVAGYPSLSLYSTLPTDQSTFAVGPVAWSPNYYPSPPPGCQIGTGGGGTCISPGDYDLIVETRLGTDTNVSWVHYYLSGTTLFRAVVPKPTTGGDPFEAFSAPGLAVPFLANVMNNPGGAQLAQITATYPTMFPGGVPQPIFQYMCNIPAGPTNNLTQPVPCPTTSALYGQPQNISDVDVTLIVATPQRDAQTQMLKLVELNGRGHTLNSTY